MLMSEAASCEEISFPRNTPMLAWGALAWLICAIWLIQFVDRGWVPHDEGLLAQTAERTATGEMPHRDFDDAYTGGLAYFHAAGFRVFGSHILTTRWMLYGATLFCVPFCYAIALRFCPPPIAALSALLCVVWSVPNYFTSLPGWYLLYLSLISVYSLTRFSETGKTRWLIAAGVTAGVSLLAKINGLYIVAGGLLFLLYDNQRTSQSDSRLQSCWSLLATSVITSSLLLLIGLLIRRDLSAGTAWHYLLPSIAVGMVLIVRELELTSVSFVKRVQSLLKSVGIYAAAVSAAPATFTVWYLAHGELDQLVQGVFVLAQRRLTVTALPVPPLPFSIILTVICTLPFAAILLRGLFVRSKHSESNARLATERKQSGSALAVGSACFLLTGLFLTVVRQPFWHHAVWSAVRVLPPLLCVGASTWLMQRRRVSAEQQDNPKDVSLFALLAACATLSLVQYPYAANIYFCYFAPLVILTAIALRSAVPTRFRSVDLSLMVFLASFAMVSLNQGFRAYHPDIVNSAFVKSDLPRTDLRIPESDRERYRRIIALIQTMTKPGEPILAFPDCPEIYFLTERANPTRTIYDFFTETPDRNQELIQLIDEKRLQAVVINREPIFSNPISSTMQNALLLRFPERYRVGPFDVWLRNDAAPNTSGPVLLSHR